MAKRVGISAGTAILALALAVPAPASASHSADRRYWDTDNDGWPNSYQTFYAHNGAANWSDLALTRLTNAGSEWSGRTEGNPKVVRWTSAITHTNRRVYLIDSSNPTTPECEPGLATGVACIRYDYYPDNAYPGVPNHFRITRATITINARDHTMWIGSGFPSGASYFDLQGVSTHEFGHGMGLFDMSNISEPPCTYTTGDSNLFWTMCQGNATPNASYHKRTVEPDDKDSMAELYTGF